MFHSHRGLEMFQVNLSMPAEPIQWRNLSSMQAVRLRPVEKPIPQGLVGLLSRLLFV